MLSLVLAAALVFTPRDADLAMRVTRTLVTTCTPRDAGTPRGQIAANYILDATSAVGANVWRDRFKASSPTGEKTFTNVYAEFKSDETNRWVVFVSHYDTKPGSRCPGANDGAATSGLLVALADALARRTHPTGNVMLIWTDGEECVDAYMPNDGFQGSRHAAKKLKESGLSVQAVICLDMLGDRDLAITIPMNSHEKLARIAQFAAQRIGEPKLVSRSEYFVKDDHVAFLDQGFRAIDLIDFSYGPDNAWWHTPDDTIDKISEKSLLKSGRLAVELLNILL